MDFDFKDAIKIKKEKNSTTNIYGDSAVLILLDILKELKEINQTLTRHDITLMNHENRITKLEDK